jgi:hypothetical protein
MRCNFNGLRTPRIANFGSTTFLARPGRGSDLVDFADRGRDPLIGRCHGIGPNYSAHTSVSAVPCPESQGARSLGGIFSLLPDCPVSRDQFACPAVSASPMPMEAPASTLRPVLRA